MEEINELINKSLDDLDQLVENFSNKDSVSKAVDDEDLKAGDVSKNAPEEEPEDDNTPDPEDDPNTSDPDTDADTEGEEDTDEDDESVEKSLEDDLKSNEGVRKALEVSEFLDAMVKSISSILSENSENVKANNEQLAKSLESNKQSTDLLGKSLVGIMKSQKAVLSQNAELQKSVRTLSKRVKQLEAQPQVRKSVQTNAKPINKSFNASAGVSGNDGSTLSKSEISNKLFEGVQADKINADELLAFEGTGNIDSLSENARSYVGLQ